MSPCEEECTLLQEFRDQDETFKTNMLIIFLKIHYNIISTTPYDYISLFTDENIMKFILDF
jgi:hypothetical protein